MVERATETAVLPAALIAEVERKRARLAGNLDELAVRLTPHNLIHSGLQQARGVARQEAKEAMSEVQSLIEDMTDDGLAWARDNRMLLLGGALAAVTAAAFGARAARKTRPVPLYAAYNQEYRVTQPRLNQARDNAAKGWDKVKTEAESFGNLAGEAYYSARSKAAGASVAAREAAHDAAEIARETAHDAAIKAREAAERAREAAADAGQWAKRQPDEHPASVVIIGLAIGAIIGAMLPRSPRENALLGPSRDSIAGKAKHGMQMAIDAASASLEGTGTTVSAARMRLDEFVEVARTMAIDAITAAADRIRSGR